MIVTRKFVFIHLHKAGGTFVNAFLTRFFPRARQVGYHLPVSELPAESAHLPRFGVVRNPWDYYVSWHTFQSKAVREPNAFYLVNSDQKREGFKGTVRNLVNLGVERERLEQIRATLPDHFVQSGINIRRQCLDELVDSKLGFFSFLVRRMFGDGDRTTFGRMESLRADFSAFLESAGVEITEPMRAFLAEAPRMNATTHEPYRAYYDEELRQLVSERDRPVIERFGYEF